MDQHELTASEEQAMHPRSKLSWVFLIVGEVFLVANVTHTYLFLRNALMEPWNRPGSFALYMLGFSFIMFSNTAIIKMPRWVKVLITSVWFFILSFGVYEALLIFYDIPNLPTIAWTFIMLAFICSIIITLIYLDSQPKRRKLQKKQIVLRSGIILLSITLWFGIMELLIQLAL